MEQTATPMELQELCQLQFQDPPQEIRLNFSADTFGLRLTAANAALQELCLHTLNPVTQRSGRYKAPRKP